MTDTGPKPPMLPAARDVVAVARVPQPATPRLAAFRSGPKWTRPTYWVPPIALLGVIVALVYVVNAALGTRGFLLPRPE